MRYWEKLSQPDEIRPGAISSGLHRVQLTSCHPDYFGKLRMSSGWHSTLTKSHPDEILLRAKSSGRLWEQLFFICHPDDLLHRQCVYWLMHAYAIGTRAHSALDLRIRVNVTVLKTQLRASVPSTQLRAAGPISGNAARAPIRSTIGSMGPQKPTEQYIERRWRSWRSQRSWCSCAQPTQPAQPEL